MNQKTEMMMDRLLYDTRWKDLKKDINKHFALDINDKNRGRHLVEARWIYYHICFKFFDMPVLRIGKSLNKNHATVLYGLNQFKIFYDIDPVFKQKFHKFLTGKQYHFIEKDLSKEELEYQLNIALSQIVKLKKQIANFKK